MATELKDMVIKQVHLVGSPAIRKRYLIVKSEEKESMSKQQQDDAEDEADNGADEADENADGSKKKSKSDGSGDMSKSIVKARDASLIKSVMEILKSIESDEAKAALQALSPVETMPVEKSSKSTIDEVTAVMKSIMPEIIKSEVEPFQKALDSTKAELDEVRKSNAVLVGEKVEREIEEIVKNLSGDRETNLTYIRLMKSKLSDEEFQGVVKREQEKAETLRKSALLTERGSTGYSATPSGDSPYQQLTDLANAVIQKSGSTDMPFTDAFAKACAERPDLWNDYRRSSYDNRSRED